MLAALVLLIFGKASTKGALEGLNLCGQVLVPSLFPFMAVSSFVVKSGLSTSMERIGNVVTKPIFGLKGKCFATILLSIIGGYPVGARGIKTLYDSGEINQKEAAKMAYFCVGSGPSFLITFLGTNLLNSVEIGLCIFAAQIISVIILGFVNKYIFGRQESFNSNKDTKIKKIPISEAIVDAAISGTYGAIEMCGIVIIFSAFLGVIKYLLLSQKSLYSSISVFLEVTSACNHLAENGSILPIAFAVGFGGLCVHFQIFQALKGIRINKAVFFLFRIIQGFITCLFTYLFISIFKVTIPVFSSIKGDAKLLLSSSMIGSSLLIITGLCFLYTLKNFRNSGG